MDTNNSNWDYTVSGFFNGKPCLAGIEPYIIFPVMTRLEAHKFIESEDYRILSKAGFDIHLPYKK